MTPVLSNVLSNMNYFKFISFTILTNLVSHLKIWKTLYSFLLNCLGFSTILEWWYSDFLRKRNKPRVRRTNLRCSIEQNHDWIKIPLEKNVINDPLDQIHSPTSSDHYFHAEFVLFCDSLIVGKYVRTEICTKIMITISRVCGSAEWIKI